MYVVIACVDREIYKIGEADTPSEATEVMRRDFMEEFENNNRTEEEFEKGIGKGEEWDFYKSEAWLNGEEYDYDWKIITVGK